MNDKKILVDTNILIDFLRDHTQAADFLIEPDQPFLISTITISELYRGVRGKNEEKLLKKLLDRFESIPVSFAIAKRGGLIKNKYGKIHGSGIADAVIAATTLEKNAKLRP